MKKLRNILIIGPQGSGKDTQSFMLSKKMKVPFIVMGDLLRQEMRKKTPRGNIVSKLFNRGQLVPDKMAFSLLKRRLRKKDVKKGFILDGFPRNLPQALMLEKIAPVEMVFELWISDKESLRRISGRRFCPNCKATYHLIYHKPKKAGICDKCGHALITREDDKPPVIKKRLGIYHQQTEAVLPYYKKKNIYQRINGEQPIRRVFAEILKKINILNNDNNQNTK